MESTNVTLLYVATYPDSDLRNKFTRQQILKLMEDHPEAYDFIQDYPMIIFSKFLAISIHKQ